MPETDILETLKGMANFMYWPASRYVYQPAIAEIESLRSELTAMRSKMEAAEDLADLLKTLDRLGGLGLDKHQWISESLDRWDKARKASDPLDISATDASGQLKYSPTNTVTIIYCEKCGRPTRNPYVILSEELCACTEKPNA